MKKTRSKKSRDTVPLILFTSVPEPDPLDPYVLGPSGYGSVIYLYGIRLLPIYKQKMKKNLDFFFYVTSL